MAAYLSHEAVIKRWVLLPLYQSLDVFVKQRKMSPPPLPVLPSHILWAYTDAYHPTGRICKSNATMLLVIPIYYCFVSVHEWPRRCMISFFFYFFLLFDQIWSAMLQLCVGFNRVRFIAFDFIFWSIYCFDFYLALSFCFSSHLTLIEFKERRGPPAITVGYSQHGRLPVILGPKSQ